MAAADSPFDPRQESLFIQFRVLLFMSGRVIVPRVSSRVSNFKAKQALELTESAGKRLSYLLEHKPNVLGIRLGVKKRGCSGLSYTLDYATEKKPADEVVKQHGVTVFIEPQALMKVIGTQMDFVEDHLKSEFVFINPNAKSVCGCKESFNTD